MRRLSQMACNDPNSAFLCAEDGVKEGEMMCVSEFKHGNIILQHIPECKVDEMIMVSREVIHLNMKYSLENAIILSEDPDQVVELGSIQHVIVHQGEKYLLTARLTILQFEESLNAYRIELKVPHEYVLLNVKDILHNQELPDFYINSFCYTILLYYCRIEMV